MEIEDEKSGIIDVDFLLKGVKAKIPLGYLYVDEIAFRMINFLWTKGWIQ